MEPESPDAACVILPSDSLKVQTQEQWDKEVTQVGRKKLQDGRDTRGPRHKGVPEGEHEEKRMGCTSQFAFSEPLTALISSERTQPGIKARISPLRITCPCPTFQKSKHSSAFQLSYMLGGSIPMLWPLSASRDQTCKLALAHRPFAESHSYQVHC